jgi:hypothetical protein
MVYGSDRSDFKAGRNYCASGAIAKHLRAVRVNYEAYPLVEARIHHSLLIDFP